MAAEKFDKEGYAVFAGCLNENGEGASNLKKNCSDKLKLVALDVTDNKSVALAGKFVRENLGDLRELYYITAICSCNVLMHDTPSLCCCCCIVAVISL
jgi:hypothetical protein